MQSPPAPRRKTDQRQIERHQLGSYLAVYNARTGRSMGQIGNLSASGLMLISLLPVMVGHIFDMQVRIPDAEGERIINFQALSHWCQADVSPGHFDSGFSIVSNQREFSELGRMLERYFRFTYLDDA
ncbi:PilZ domain-containing protein [Pseudomonas sp.]|jgi:hypothetical protein|uniref:PilZ domain-containing protein n=1 Tax=Pseudomonas sp. TaxID=306 RepID=UPI00272C3988|nr:PilZ domain-containing protein [Pseudomonas sp.]